MLYKNFTIPKGDSLTFKLTLVDAETAPDNIYLTIKKNSQDSDFVLQKYIDNGITRTEDEEIIYEVNIPANETEKLELLNYIYGIKFVYGSEENTEVEGKIIITPETTSTAEED